MAITLPWSDRPFLWPWEQADPETGIPISQYEDPAGPVQANGLFYSIQDSTFGVDFGKNLQASIDSFATNVSKAVDRITTKQQVEQKQQTSFFGGIRDSVSETAGAVGSAIQSTLIKIIVIVVIVAFVGLYVMSYAQVKGGQLAKA